jgi:glycine reductase complex component B subunit alpha and beta
MKLTVHDFDVRSLGFGPRTGLDGHHLTVNPDELIEHLARDPALASIDVRLARPGERTRIVNVLGITEPRAKVGDDVADFPGVLGPLRLAGVGSTNVLRNVAVIEAGFVKPSKDGDTRQGVVDMTGPIARFTPFSRTQNLVLLPFPAPGIDRIDYIRAVNRAGLQAAAQLARRATIDHPVAPDATEVYQLDPTRRAGGGLPRIAYICQAFWLADGWESFVYGTSMKDILPTVLHPNEILDGALVSCNYGSPASIRNPTYAHQNNTVIRTLYELHGKALDFAGVVLTPQPSVGDVKERCSLLVAKLVKYALGADGVVLSKESGGHADVDTMLNCRNCEALGVRTVLMMDLLEGDALLCATPTADAIVSLGKSTERVRGERVDAVLGGSTLAGVNGPIDGEIEIPLSMISCSTSLFGDTYLSTVET